ncbi:ribbon-helix-helix protein, CopG family [Actinophytocola sp.]|uniref:ribbon-helix-helix protein, CopG family n=1 Tax=Actinophytocola sp. TaxID=1872138 RepID=UPI002ED47FED
MKRTRVSGRRHGWFDLDKAEAFPATEEGGGRVLRTARGQWVAEATASGQGEALEYRQLDDDTARQWLRDNGHDEAVRRFFDEDERPRDVEGAVYVRLGELAAELDVWATRAGVTRPEAVRRAVRQLLEHHIEKPADCSCSCDHQGRTCLSCGCGCGPEDATSCPCCGVTDDTDELLAAARSVSPKDALVDED